MHFYKEILSPILNSIERFSTRNAFCIDKVHYTYVQLSQCISKVRVALQQCKYQNTKVGLVINDDLETYASIIALWMEGDCYVPLHPNWPLERCLDICEQVELDLVLDSSEKSRYICNEFANMMSDMEVEYVNLLYTEPFASDSSCFRDNAHLNTKGAEMMTDTIIKIMNILKSNKQTINNY